MPEITLSALNIYPIKSLRGIAVGAGEIQPRGLRWDRRWMIVDALGDFMTQRDYPQMARVRVDLTPYGLLCAVPDDEPLLVPYAPESRTATQVTVWRDTVAALPVSYAADLWFSRVLGKTCRLVQMPDATERRVNTHYAHNGEVVSFADGYPFLLIGQASLDDLNARMETPLPMNRFRPNLVIAGADPFAEDTWHHIQIGGATFAIVKPCARCELTMVDQERGVVAGKEPLRTLATFRKVGSNVLFGQNLLLAEGSGTLHVGDAVRLLD
jgi:uncharacterized protein YcbX